MDCGDFVSQTNRDQGPVQASFSSLQAARLEHISKGAHRYAAAKKLGI
jgi:hypothetical protein